MKMKATDYIARFLVQHGVRDVFEVSGGMITHLLDSCYRLGGPRIISVRHEQAAGFAAEGWARMTGVPGVALATSGPGATNLLTAVGSCYFDSTPAVFITGQVNRHERKGTRDVRQLGFQETDIVAVAKPITKAAWQVETPEALPEMLERAFATALGDRPGPVLLDIPMDVQRSDITAQAPGPEAKSGAAATGALAKDLDELLAAIGKAARPMLLAGGGVRSGSATEAFRAVVHALGIPVVHSLMAVDVLPFADPLRVGMIGTYGNRWANLAMGRSDLLLVLGSRLDIRQTGSDVAAFQAGRSIFQVDVQAGEMNQRVTGCHAICSDLVPFLTALRERLAAGARKSDGHGEWKAEIAELRKRWPDTAETQGAAGINPNAFIHALSRASTAASSFSIDVGQHQMWAAQSVELGPDQRFLTSGGMGSMGFGLPAAIGAAFACAPRPAVLVAGDGGFQHNIHELQTIAHHHLPVKMVVMNNGCHGMVRQFQESYFESRFQSTQWGYSAPDFEKVAKAYGIAASTITDEAAVAAGLAELWRDPAAPALLQVMIDTATPIYPKIAFGRPFTEMEPQAKPTDMEST